MNDLTVIFLTINKVPQGWANYHRQVLTEAIGESPVITISRVPMDWGTNLIQDEKPSTTNIYKQLLRGAKLATTKYIAVAEDDTLYHKSHFEFRPPEDTFGYDYHRFGLFTWGKPTYYYKDRISNASLVAPRELVVKSLEERFKYYLSDRISELGNEKGTQLERYKMKFFYSEVAMVYFSHINGLDPTEQHKTKKMSPIQAYDIPHWGRAEDLVKRWRE